MSMMQGPNGIELLQAFLGNRYERLAGEADSPEFGRTVFTNPGRAPNVFLMLFLSIPLHVVCVPAKSLIICCAASPLVILLSDTIPQNRALPFDFGPMPKLGQRLAPI